MKGNYYAGAVIDGTRNQYDTLVSRHSLVPDDGRASVQEGFYRIRLGLLIFEIEGWGEEMQLFEEIAREARALGCKVSTARQEGLIFPTGRSEPPVLEGADAPLYWTVKGCCPCLGDEYAFAAGEDASPEA